MINGLETHPPLLPLSTMEEVGVQVLLDEMIEGVEVDLPSGWILLVTMELEMTDVAGTFLSWSHAHRCYATATDQY